MSLLRFFGLARLPRRPKGHPPFAFHDHKGRAYYAFPHVGVMPPSRMGPLQDIMIQIDSGMMHKDAEAIGSYIGKFIDEAAAAKEPKARTEALSKARFGLNELVTRPRKIIMEEAYYSLAAICAVRQDEDPEKFDEAIHMEKVETFRSAGRAGLRFFTDTPISATLLGAPLTTREGFLHLQQSWAMARARREAIGRVISSNADEGTPSKVSA